MRTRVVRDLVTISGIAVILAGLVFTNSQIGRMGLIDKFEKMRKTAEQMREAQGVSLLKWDLMRSTKGTIRSGPNFVEDLVKQDRTLVNLVGFIYPIEEFRDMKEFMLLPLPIQCYFCQAPPPRDIFLVKMEPGKATNAYEEPVLVTGELVLYSEPASKFFYAINNADVQVGRSGTNLTNKKLAPEHKLHMEQEGAPPQEELLDPIPPTPQQQ